MFSGFVSYHQPGKQRGPDSLSQAFLDLQLQIARYDPTTSDIVPQMVRSVISLQQLADSLGNIPRTCLRSESRSMKS